MELRSKLYVAGGCVCALAVSFACGRFSVSPPTVKTTVDQQAQTNTEKEKDTHTQTKIVEVKQPSGAVETTTTIDQVSTAHTEQQKTVDTQMTQTVTPPKKNTLNLSVLYGTQIGSNFGVPQYGLSVTKSVLGPLTVGAYGFTNGMVGVSLGMSF